MESKDRILSEIETDKVLRFRTNKNGLGFVVTIDMLNKLKAAQDANTLILVVASTLKKVGEALSAIGYYEKPQDFLVEYEEYQKAEALATKNLIQ